MEALVPGRQIVGDGVTPELAWRQWLRTVDPRKVTLDDLVTSEQRLVVVSPHPDDEVLACGGLIAMHAARGGRVAIVAITDGEASHRGDADWPDERVAATRVIERDRGLRWLGLGSPVVARLGLADSGVAPQRDGLESALRAVLKPADRVVTTWRADGHPDHDATGAATATACDALGLNLIEAPVWAWHWSRPGDPRVPWHRLCALPLTADASERKTAALAEHVSQLAERLTHGPVLGRAIVSRAARDAEYFFS
jgi:LmbE family N-acetylglucosaminyl deacetylase